MEWESMRIASHVDLYRLATIALCNVTQHDEDRWTRPYFHRTDPARLADALKSLIDKLRIRILDTRYIVAVVYDESKGSDSEWGQANMREPVPVLSPYPWLNPRPTSTGELDIVGFIVVDLGHDPASNFSADVRFSAPMRAQMKGPESLYLR
jgi:hypothetical protein